MTRKATRAGWTRLWMASSTLLALGGCGLSDQQLTQILSSVFSSGLTALVTALTTALTSGLTGTGSA